MEVNFKNVTKKYGNTIAVKDLNLKIESGALHFLLGPSGCGKTTTLRMLAGLEKVTSGAIFFDGKDVTNLPAADRGIGMVFQNYALWPHMSVRENVAYGLKLRNLSKSEIEGRINEALQITQLTPFASRAPGQLSGGQQQRVALARALAIRPNVLLLDEPLSNLDAKLRLEMRDNISRIHKQTGITTLYVTHDQKEALSMGTSISIMHGGNLIQTGTPRSLYREPATPFIAGFIGETNIIPGRLKSVESDHVIVATCLGEIKSNRFSKGLGIGKDVYVSIRPEAIQLELKHSGQSQNRFEVNLQHLTYLGESEQLQLVKGDLFLKANQFNAADHGLNDGDGVRIYLPETDTLVLPPDSNLGANT
ncbi:MAG: ABC transporter ATP-binding protein [Proteobacteria bacterium]|nr:ABC transporter ATP-binding protein [Pseudomonadota bacterium]